VLGHFAADVCAVLHRIPGESEVPHNSYVKSLCLLI
jgi:hypothetical protein